jgi:REP element-mobilizing transposase RayT
MARPPRLDAPGVTHHVWSRAVEGRPIFVERSDGDRLVGRLDALCEALRSRCFAWTLMSNHLHLVIRTDEGCLSRFMHRMKTAFAGGYNKQRSRQGHVFQSRFGSRVVRDEGDLVNLIRYVHKNPLQAGLVADLEGLSHYRWCGHAALVGRRPAFAFEAVDDALACFASDRTLARLAYQAQLERDEEPAEAPDSLGALIHSVCRELGVSEADLMEGRRLAPVSEARARVCERAVRELGLRARDVARRLGVSEGAVSQALRRVSKVPGQTPF